MAEYTGKVFENFLELPPNVRTEIIDEMAPNDRCRFTRCSKLSNQEAKASKNYIYGMYVICEADAVAVILIFDENGIHQRRFEYIQRSAKTIKQSLTMDRRILWSVDLDSSKNLDQHVSEEVGRIFQSHGSIIKYLSILDLSMRNLDLDIELLESLEALEVTGDTDLLDILSRLPKPLKQLRIDKAKDNARYIDCEQIHQVKELLIWKGACLNKQRFLKLLAREIMIPIGQLTEKDIISLIRSWQNATLGKNIEAYRWNWENSSFDKKKLARLLRLSEFHLNRENAEFEIKHFYEPGRSAKLCFMNEFLNFDTVVQEEEED